MAGGDRCARCPPPSLAAPAPNSPSAGGVVRCCWRCCLRRCAAVPCIKEAASAAAFFLRCGAALRTAARAPPCITPPLRGSAPMQQALAGGGSQCASEGPAWLGVLAALVAPPPSLALPAPYSPSAGGVVRWGWRCCLWRCAAETASYKPGVFSYKEPRAYPTSWMGDFLRELYVLADRNFWVASGK